VESNKIGRRTARRSAARREPSEAPIFLPQMPGDRPTGSKSGRSGSSKSQRAHSQRSRPVEEMRKKNLEDGSLTARAEEVPRGGGTTAGHYFEEGYDVVAYIGCMLNNGRALARANMSDDSEFSTDEEVQNIKVQATERMACSHWKLRRLAQYCSTLLPFTDVNCHVAHSLATACEFATGLNDFGHVCMKSRTTSSWHRSAANSAPVGGRWESASAS
jgi:hypothetical protein